MEAKGSGKKAVAARSNRAAGSLGRTKPVSVVKEPLLETYMPSTGLEKMEMVEKGLLKSVLEKFKQRAGLDYDHLAELLKVSRVKLISKKSAERFDSDLSDKIMSLIDLYNYGFEVFGDDEKFRRWIHKPNYFLNGKMPFDLIINSYGRQELRDMLGRIDYGVYS